MTDMNDPVIKAIVKARVQLYFTQPFFGNLATRMHLIDATKWCKTAATDGRNLYYNREFIKSLEPQQLVFLISHEVLHCVFDHLGRKGHRDHEILNMAQDYIINYLLVKENIGKMPKCGLYDTAYTDEMTSEEVYNLLLQNSTEIKMTLDEHLDLDGGNSGDGSNGNGNGERTSVRVMGDSDGPPKLTEEDKQQIRNEIKCAIITSAHCCGAGKIPLGIKRLIDAFTNPIMDWRELLETHIKSSIKDDFSFQRPSKRSWSSGRRMILPGQKFMDTIDIAVSIDTSGSMTDDMLRDFLTEVKGIMETFQDFKLILWTFDTQVYNPVVYTPENISEIVDYEPEGGGGTMFESNWDFMKDPNSAGFGDLFPDAIEPKKFVMFTDGLPNSGWGDENYCDTLFVIHGNNDIEAPFGLTARYAKPSRHR